jgi:hypothetical protein
MDAAPIDSRITAVTVYSRGALVTRVAEVERLGGRFPAAVRLTGLPLVIDDTSVRARVEAPDGAAHAADDLALPVARDLRVVLETPQVEASETNGLEEELIEAQRGEDRLRALLDHLEHDLARLDKIRLPKRPPGKEGSPPPLSPVDARVALLGFRSDRVERLIDEQLQLRKELRRAELQRKEVQDRLLRASTDRQLSAHELCKAVLLSLSGDGDGERVKLLVDYRVPGARWAPVYTVRVAPDRRSSRLAIRARVAQQTGEDWSGVRLTLSTAQAQRWAELPELPSLRIGRRLPPVPRRGWRPPPTDTLDLYADFDLAFASSLDEEVAMPAPEPAAGAEPAAAETLLDLEEDLGLAAEPEAESMLALEDDASLEEDTFGGAPMAAQAALAAPAAAEPPAAVLSAAVGAAPAAPPPPSSRLRAGATEGAPPDAALAGIAIDSPLGASDEMLEYGHLRMPPPGSPRRGQLVVTTRLQLYLEVLAEHEVSFRDDLAQVLATATEQAESAGDHLPAGCHLASSVEGFDHAWSAQTTLDIPSDGHFHSLPLAVRPAPLKMLYVTVPREASDVFRVAIMENPLPGPLLPGPVDIYLDDQFLVSGALETTPTGGAIQLGLGVEEAVKVSRNTRYREDVTGLTRGILAFDHEIDIEVINHLDHGIDLEVRERLPVVRDEEKEIKIELGDVSPLWRPYEPPLLAGGEPLKGGRRWNLRLDAAEKQQLRAKYRIRIPSKNELVGGNRRER